MALYQYKHQNTKHGNRIQNIEESFSKGMQYTNTPLTEGFLKTIVNMDMQDGGVSLKPRPGIRTVRAYNSVDAITGRIISAREQIAGGVPWSQFFVKGTLPAGDYPIAPLSILIGNPNTAYAPEFTGTPTKVYSKITYANSRYSVPVNAQIHGLQITDPSQTMARHIGATCWNDNYYFFDTTAKKVVHTEYNAGTGVFEFIANNPKAVTSKEATMWGYNMLLTAPYTFADEQLAAGLPLNFTGMLPYDTTGALCLAPVVNQTINFRAYYATPLNKPYRIIWEWRTLDASEWTPLQTQEETFASLVAVSTQFSPPADSVILRVSAYGYTAGVINALADSVLAVGFNLKKEDYGSTANTQPKIYSVFDSKGMTYWKNRLVCWGAPEDPTILFMSEVNDPTYFPFPNNVETFDEPVRYAVPFLDYLLVFTATKLYLITLSSDGLAFTTQCIQNNLTISDWDWHLVQVVKNMVFFRSGNYYYMIVPRSGSTSGELTLAPVSRPLQYLFDNFQSSIAEIIKSAYDYKGTLDLVHYYNYLDFEDVHNVYVFKTEESEYLNVVFLYNTVSRSWRLYMMGSQELLIPYRANATQRGMLCTYSTSTRIIPQLMQYFNTNNADYYIPNSATAADAVTLFDTVHYFRNWQHLDTGYREHNSNFKKRYRELQFVVNNISGLALKFFSDFFIDGEQRLSRYRKEVVQELDIASPDYGIITVETVLVDPTITPSATLFATDANDTEAWLLDVSTFPNVSFWKTRLLISGKGYTPCFILTCRTEAQYELLNLSWVYRDMFSR